MKNLSKNEITKVIKNNRSVISLSKKNIYKNITNDNISCASLDKRRNLTYTKFYSYKYNYNNILEKKFKNPSKEIKNELMESNYSTFFSNLKNSKNKNLDFLKICLNGSSPHKKLTNIKYHNIYTPIKKSKGNIMPYSALNTKLRSLSRKNIKSNILNNSPFKKELLILPQSASRVSIHMNFIYDIPKTEKGDINSFMEKCRFVRKEKIRNFILENQFYCLKEKNKEELNLFKIKKNNYLHSLSLLNKFDKSYEHYLNNLETETNKEIKICNELSLKKIDLEKTINKLIKQVNKISGEINKYKNVKRFLDKYGYYKKEDNIKNKNYKKDSLFLTETNNNNDNNKSEILDDEHRYTNIFTYIEDNILNDIKYYNGQIKILNKYKNRLLNTKYSIEDEHNYNNELIETKTKKLNFLKKENGRLTSEYEAIMKTASFKENFEKNIEHKLYIMLTNFNKDFNVEEKLDIKNLFEILQFKSDEFQKKIHKTKSIYMIKIIELLSSFFHNLNLKYMHDPHIKKKLVDTTNQIQKERKEKVKILNKEQLKQKLKEKKLNLIKKTNKIRFFSYKKYDIKYLKNNQKHNMKKRLNDRTETEINYKDWLTFY
jgi:hypothetical protein